MSEETGKHGPGPNQEGFEHEDLGARSIFIFLIVLVGVCAFSYFVIQGLYDYLDAYDRTHQPAVSPMKAPVQSTVREPVVGVLHQKVMQTFPEPRLEDDERDELHDVRLHEEQVLASYGWVDEKNGVVRIPIERAMQLIAERGLPVRPQEQSATEAGGKGKEAGKKAK
jgi:hypothetical protein